jgi:hypothetical protein
MFKYCIASIEENSVTTLTLHKDISTTEINVFVGWMMISWYKEFVLLALS